ncbi:MAG TPA: ABC transporter permease [Thermomicrobiales bacterium]|nr:ABC transporter permease [Thermomicrobiales bacterium]
MVSMDPAIERGAARVAGGESPPRIAPPRVRLPSRGFGTVQALIVPLLILAIWQLAVNQEVYSRGQLPALVDVIAAGRELQEIGLLVPNVLASVQRVSIGWGVGAAVAMILGLAVGFSRPVEGLLAPTLNALRAVPSLAWVPLFVLWLGIGETPKLTLIALGAFFPVYANLVSGIRQIDRKLIEVGHAYGLRGWNLMREILLPAAFPSLATGLRLGLAQAWLFLVAAELIAASRGLGFLLIDGQNSGRADIILLSILLLALLGKGTDWLLARGERRLLRWSDTFRGTA